MCKKRTAFAAFSLYAYIQANVNRCGVYFNLSFSFRPETFPNKLCMNRQNIFRQNVFYRFATHLSIIHAYLCMETETTLITHAHSANARKMYTNLWWCRWISNKWQAVINANDFQIIELGYWQINGLTKP